MTPTSNGREKNHFFLKKEKLARGKMMIQNFEN